MNDAGAQKVNRRGFLKWAIAAGIGAAAVAGGAAAFLGERQAPSPTTTPKPAGEVKQTGSSEKWGRIGDPIALAVGYLPYCTCNYDGSLIRQTELWKKYLPQGSTIEWFESLSPSLVNNNLIAGKNQIIHTCDTPSSKAIDSTSTTIICSTAYEYGHPDYLEGVLHRRPILGDRKRTTPPLELGGKYAPREVPKTFDNTLLVRTDLLESGEVKDVRDLDGRKIGIGFGSMMHRQIETIKKIYGINPTLLDQSMELQVAQLSDKQIDAVVTCGVNGSRIERRGLAEIFISAPEHQCICNTGTHLHMQGIVLVLDEIVEQRPDVIKAWLQAEEDAKETLATDFEHALDLAHSDTPDVPRDAIKEVLQELAPDGYPYDKAKECYKQNAAYWRQLGILKGEKSANMDDFVNKYAYRADVKAIFDEVIEEREKQGKYHSGTGEILKYW